MLGDVTSFVPGPAHVRPEILQAMAVPPRPHRSPAVRVMLRRVQTGLRDLLGTGAIAFPVLGSGTTALESALRGVGRSSALIVAAGAFGERLRLIADSIGLATEHLTVPPGWPIDPDVLERALAAGEFDTVALTHCETQTGALSDLPALAEVVSAHAGVALVVDAVSSFGGVRIRMDDLAEETVLVSVSGKALACPPGVAVMAVSDAAAERAASAQRGGYALRLETLVERARDSQTPQTPSTPLLHALDAQLPAIAEEGLVAREARHREMAALVHEWAGDRFEVLAREDARSPTVTTLENTQGIDVGALLAGLEMRGYRIADGYGELRGATFRIGHMGDVTPDETRELLSAMDEVVAEIA